MTKAKDDLPKIFEGNYLLTEDQKKYIIELKDMANTLGIEVYQDYYFEWNDLCDSYGKEICKEP